MSAVLKQVRLVRDSGPAAGIKQDVAWIDAEYAVVNKCVVKYGDPAWLTWRVAEVYGTRTRAWVEGSGDAHEHFFWVSQKK